MGLDAIVFINHLVNISYDSLPAVAATSDGSMTPDFSHNARINYMYLQNCYSNSCCPLHHGVHAMMANITECISVIFGLGSW